MTIHPSNNDYDLKSIEVWTAGSFAVGGTLSGRASFRDWLVHWRDETTLMIAPKEDPDAWRPAHIYGRGGCEGMPGLWVFALTPSAEIEAAIARIDYIIADLNKARDLAEREDTAADTSLILDSLEYSSERLVEALGGAVEQPAV